MLHSSRGKSGKLTEIRIEQADDRRILMRRAKSAGLNTLLGNHTLLAIGITNYLEHGGALEMAQFMAGHADPRATKLYDRRQKMVSRSEVERIRYERKGGGL